MTTHRHKSLVPVCNRPAIDHLFSWLQESGFERVVLAIGRANEDLAEAYPEGYAHGFQLVHVMERERLESGGAIRHAVQATDIEGRFAVLNGDVFVDFDFGDALRAHEAAEASLTLALSEVSDPSQFGVAVLDAAGMVEGFVEKPPPGTAPSSLVNAGVWIFEPGLVDEIPPGAVRVEETLFPSLVARRRRVLGYRFDGTWADIGTPGRYLELNLALLANGRAGVDRPGTSTSLIDEGAHIAAGVTVARSCVGPGSVLGRGAMVQDSVLWEDVSVAPGAQVRGSILADGVRVGEDATLSGAVVGRGVVVAPGARLTDGAIVEAGASVS